jgi:hypothetical protein
MKTKLYTYTSLLLIMVVSLISCKSVNKLYQKGDYEQAVYTAVKKIKKNKLTPETKELIADAYAKAVIEMESEIAYHASSTNELKWEPVAQKYRQLQNLSNAIQNSEEALQYVRPKNYTHAIQEATANAVAVRKQRGLNYRNDPSKLAAKKAYTEFEIAKQMDWNNTEIQQLLDDAYANAVTNIVVAPVQTRYYNDAADTRILENTILCNLQNTNANRFTKYYTNYQAQHNNIRVDNLLSLYYEGIDASREHINNSEKNIQKENVLLREIRIRADSVVKEYGTVYATYKQYKTTQNFTGKVYITLQDARNNQLITNRSIDADYCYTNEYATYTGDQRALTNDQLTLAQKNRTYLDREQMVQNLSTELGRKVANELQYFLR